MVMGGGGGGDFPPMYTDKNKFKLHIYLYIPFSSFYSKRHFIDRQPTPASQVPNNAYDSEDDLDKSDSDDDSDSVWQPQQIESETDEEIIDADTGDEEEVSVAAESRSVDSSCQSKAKLKKQSGKEKFEKFKWSNNESFTSPRESQIDEERLKLDDALFTRHESPIHFFELFITDDLFRVTTPPQKPQNSSIL